MFFDKIVVYEEQAVIHVVICSNPWHEAIYPRSLTGVMRSVVICGCDGPNFTLE